MQDHLNLLKLKLQSLGPLRPEAWDSIVQYRQEITLQPGESFIRKLGTLAYVANGLLKEYDAQLRAKPTIINFISRQQCIFTRKYNESYYLKACIPSHILYWECESLELLFLDYEELKDIYESFISSYEKQTSIKLLILEQASLFQKIQLFIKHYPDILPLIKKRDIANYLNVDYDYFIRNFSKLL